MNVLLISFNRLKGLQQTKGTIPVPSLYLAAVLREAHHNPSVLDLSVLKVPDGENFESFFYKAIIKKIKETEPGLLALNTYTTMHFPFARQIAQLVKKYFPDLKIATGGIHPTLFTYDILLNCPEFDFIALGEGEEQIVALANIIETSDYEQLTRVQALGYRHHNGKITLNPRQYYIKNLDKLPLPAWDLINLPDYYADHSTWYNPKKKHIQLSTPIMSSRSCPFNCNFCACHTTMGRMFRRRTPANVVDEIQMLYEDYGQNYFGFIDDNVNLNKKHVIAVCEEIVKRGIDIQIETTCGTHIASLDEEVIDALAQAGTVFVRLPIEHGNEEMRNKIIGKSLAIEKIHEVVKLLKERKIFTSSMYIMGFPEDTIDTLEDTYRLINELDLDLNYVFNLIPFPGTRVFDQAFKDNLLIQQVDPANFWKGEINLDPVQDEKQFFVKPYNMTLDQLMNFRQRFDKLRVMSRHAQKLNNHPIANHQNGS